MLTFKVDAKYGLERRSFSQNVIAHTQELAQRAATNFIVGKMIGPGAVDYTVEIIRVREVKY